MSLHARLDRAAESLAASLIATRHHLHRFPELSNREWATAWYLERRLRAAGADEIRTGLADHGVIGVFQGGRPGPRVALRADMDALPVREASGEPFASTVQAEGPGGALTPVAHACGHDVHMATVLTAGEAFAQVREHAEGTLLCVFQSAEEGPPLGEDAGAQAMIDGGAFAGIEPDLVFGMHVSPLPSGTVGWRGGPQFAASVRFEVVVRGVATHVALPWAGVDPLPAAASIVLGCGDLTRTIAPWDAATVTCGHVQDAGRFNVIGGEVRLDGTIRAMRDGDLDALRRRLRTLAEGCAAARGCTAEVAFHQPVPAVVNAPALLDALLPALRRVVGADRVVPAPPTLGYDDVSALLRAYGGLYLLYGAQDTRWAGDALEPVPGGRGLVPNHHPGFYADDGALLDAVRVHLHVVAEVLSGALAPG